MSMITLTLSMISVLISVAFFTMMERKLLSYIQMRKGPNKVGLLGILQPFSDAIKLFNKTNTPNKLNNQLTSILSPPLSLMLSILVIPIIPINTHAEMDNKQNLILFMILSSLAVYIILLIGWSMNSKYSSMGAIRSIAQMISYEVSLFFMMLFISILSNSYSLSLISIHQQYWWFIWGNIPLFLMWITSCIAELNRSPFDFAEGESELVSGFNIEFMGGLFAMIFLAEYMSILMLSMMTTIMFMSPIKSNTSMMMIISITMMMLWVRGTFPRFRYDMLMKLSWKTILPNIIMMLPIMIFITHLN